jgi:putative transcriptional regulator
VIAAGSLLIAPPKILDPRFRESVILICEHTAQGTLGVCLNRPLPIEISSLGLGLESWLERRELYWGGPVNTHVVSVLHPRQWQMRNTVRVTDTVCMTSHHRQFHRLAEDPPAGFQAFTGFTQWAPGQLEMELKGQRPWTPHSSWLTLAVPPAFEPWELAPETMWSWAIEQSSQQAVSAWL